MPEHAEGQIIIDAATAVEMAQKVLESDRPTGEAIAIAEYLIGMLPPARPPLHEQVAALLPDGWNVDANRAEFFIRVQLWRNDTSFWFEVPLPTKLTAAEIVKHVLALAGEGEDGE